MKKQQETIKENIYCIYLFTYFLALILRQQEKKKNENHNLSNQKSFWIDIVDDELSQGISFLVDNLLA